METTVASSSFAVPPAVAFSNFEAIIMAGIEVFGKTKRWTVRGKSSSTRLTVS
jgi:hypothetical protein